MDNEILDARLSVAETAILQLDERVDAEEEQADEVSALAALEARIISLEASHSECIAQLQTTQTSLSEALARIAEAQAAEAEANAEAAEAMAEVLTEAPEPEETEIVDEEITELEPEPPGEEEAARERSPNWLEKFLALR